MAGSFQNEIPKARVNITLDVETHGSQKNMELPLKLLVMGKFNQEADKSNVATREKISINNNVSEVMQQLSPQLSVAVSNRIHNDGSDLRVNVTFNAMKDFHPEQVAMQIPELKRLIAMRNLLKELKANVIDNKTLRKELEGVMKDKVQVNQLQGALSKIGHSGGDADE